MNHDVINKEEQRALKRCADTLREIRKQYDAEGGVHNPHVSHDMRERLRDARDALRDLDEWT